MGNPWLAAGAASGMIAVAMGAFGAHGLEESISQKLMDAFHTGASYQMYHALALIAVAWRWGHTPSAVLKAAGWGFLIGTLLFSGSLYAMALTGLRGLGALTPIGGAAFLIGWACLLGSTFRPPPSRSQKR